MPVIVVLTQDLAEKFLRSTEGDKAAESCAKCMEMRKMVAGAKCPTCDGKKS